MKKQTTGKSKLWLCVLATIAVLTTTVFAVQADTDLCPCGCGTALADVQWESWTGSVDADGGHYRMEADYLYAQTKQITIADGCNVVLDLNGHTYAAEDTRIFYLTAGGKLTVLDSADGGEMMSTGKEGASGGLIYGTGAEVNLASGTLRGLVNDTPVTTGGVMHLSADSVFNMTGGTITGGYASGDGGNIYLWTGCVMNVSGGTIENGISGNRGGNVLIGEKCSFTISGGTVKGGYATEQGGNIRSNYSSTDVTVSGGTIYGDMAIYSAKKFTLSGSPKILMGNSAGLILGDGVHPTAGNVNLVATLDGLNTDAEIYISAVGAFTDTAAAEYIDCFKGALRTTVTANAETGVLEASDGDTGFCPHCWESGVPATWTSADTIQWAASGAFTKLTESAHYYLTQNITQSGNGSRLNIGGTSNRSVDILIDLAGYDLTVTNNRVAQVFAHLSVMDCAGGGMMCGATPAADTTASVAFANGGTINIYGGILCSVEGTACPVLACWSNSLNIYGGEIRGNQASGIPGSVSVGYTGRATIMNMTGGLITGGITDDNGGNLHIEKSATANISGGVITCGSAQTYGGNVACDGTLNLSGGAVVNGSAENLGGNIYVSNSGTLNMSEGFVYGGNGNTEDKYNSTTYNGDNIMINSGNMLMSGGKILNARDFGTDGKLNKGNAILGWGSAMLTLDGSAATLNGKYAGNIYVGGSAQLTVNKDFTGFATVVMRSADNRHATTPVYGTALEDGYSQGSYSGTLLLEGDYGCPNVYATEDNQLIVSGVALTDGKTSMWFADGAAANGAYENGKYIKFFADGELPLTGDRLVDLNGHNITVTGNGMLSGFDTSNDDYNGFGTAIVSGVQVCSAVKAPNDKNYIAITDENGTSFHCMGLRVSGISLRPSVAGFYYQATWQCDEALQAKIKSYGVAVSLRDMPRADFASDGDTLWTKTDSAEFVSGQAKTSAIISNIFSANAADNDNRGRRGIFAAPYVILNDGTEAGITVIGDDGNAVAGGVCYSLHDVMRKVNRMWPSLSQTQKAGVNTLYDTYADVLDTWDMYNIVAEREGTYANRPLKILTIGHSLAVDSNHLLAKVAQLEGTTDVTVGTLYYSGCRLHKHVEHLTNNTPAYTLYMSNMTTAAANQPPEQISNSTMLDGILAEDWDIIVMQMGPFENITSPTLNEDIQTVMDYVNANKTNAEAVFAWHMWWAFPEDETLLNTEASTIPDQFKNHFGWDQLAMYENIVADTQARIEPDSRFVYVIPTGTAIQNANSSYLTDLDIYRDYAHASDLSRVIAAYTWYCTVTGKTIDDIALDTIPAAMTNSYAGEGDMVLSEQEKRIVVEAVKNAIAHPYEITLSQYTVEE